jgi:sugar phosphate permease
MSAVLTEAPVARPARFSEVWLVTIGHSLTHWYPATFYILLPLIATEMGLSYSQIGLIMSCQYIAGAVSNLPGGMAVDMVGRKGFLLALSLFWIGFPYLLMGFTTSYWPLLLCISLVGVGNNLWHPAAIPTLANRFPDRKGLVLSVHGMGGNVGDALAPLAVGALLAVLTWREIVMWNLVPGVVIACLILAYLGTWGLISDAKDKAAKPKMSLKEYGGGLLNLLKNRSCAVLVTTSTFRVMSQSALLTFLPVFLAREMGYSPFAVGACLFMLQAAGFTAAPIAGHLSDRMGPRSIVISCMALTAVILAFMAIAGPSTAFIFFIALLGFFLYATRSVLQAWILDATPKNMGGTTIGLMFGAQSLGSAIAPLTAGVFADQYGLISVFYFITVTIVLANLMVFFMPKGSGAAPAKA